jgi:hypothetical protein
MGEEINNVKRDSPGMGEQITTNERKNRDGRGDKQWKRENPNNDKQKEEQGWERR